MSETWSLSASTCTARSDSGGGEPPALPTDYELHFGATGIYSNGAFVNDEVTVTHPERTVTESSGSWDGLRSNRPDAEA